MLRLSFPSLASVQSALFSLYVASMVFMFSYSQDISYLLDIKIHWLNLIKTNPRGCVIMMLGYLLFVVHDTASAKMHIIQRCRFPDVRKEVLSFSFAKGRLYIFLLLIYLYKRFMSFWNLIFSLSNAQIVGVK